MTCSQRVTDCKRIEALGGVDIGAVDIELLQFEYSSKVVVLGNMVGDSMTVGIVLGSYSGITYLSNRLATHMK